jgi:hypothetical protein
MPFPASEGEPVSRKSSEISIGECGNRIAAFLESVVSEKGDVEDSSAGLP